MSLLGNTSVRTILATVFLILSARLCTALVWQLYAAWELTQSAERAATLAGADKAIFAATYAIRQQRSDVQGAFQAPGDFAKAVENAHKNAEEHYKAGISAVEATPGIDAKALLADVRSHWNPLVTRSRELAELARGGTQRDMRVIDPWYKAMTDVITGFAGLSLNLSNAVRMTDPAIAEYVQTRQLAWATRDTGGRECGTARPFVGTAKPFTPQARETIIDLRARTDATLAQLVDVVARPGVAPELLREVQTIRDIVTKGKANRDAIYAKLDGSDKPVASASGWTEICSAPLDRIYQVAWISFDLMLQHVEGVNAAARARLRVIAAALAVSIAFCAGGLVLIRRRVAIPVAELTRTIERLAQRKYDQPVVGSGNRDEFGVMSDRLEALRLSGVEAERMAAHQIAGRDAGLKRGTVGEAECRQFETSISDMLDAVDAAGTRMTTMANAMAATAQQTAGQSTAAAQASELASSNVKTVAAAAEELASSITEIGSQVGQAPKAAGDAGTRAKSTSASIQRLSEAAQKIGDVVELINAIAGQTNLLALNATNEAARAGEVGKGFAVVASEVKSLAHETPKATEHVTTQITSIQQLRREAVGAIQDIGEVIAQIDGINATIAAAVEEQDATTHAIARNAQDVATGTAEVSHNIAGVSQVAENSGKTAAEVLAAAQAVSAQAGNVRARVETFVRQIQAA